MVWSRLIPQRRAELGGVVLLGTGGLAVRGAFLSRQAGNLDADSATVGLMARHVLQGEHYAFFWGQAYMGSLEAYVAALLFALLGPGDIALQLAPLVFSVGFTIAAYAWARQLGGPPAALATLALLAVGPPTLTLWQITPRGGYAEMLALGVLVLLLASRLGDAPTDGAGRRWIGLGLVAGLAVWTHLLSGVYLAAAAGYLLLRDPGRLRRRGPWVAGAFFALGSAPLWLYNVAEGFITFAVLMPARRLDLVGNLTVALADSLPKLLGARELTRGESLLPGPALVVVVGVPLAALVWLGLDLRRALAAGRPPPALMGAFVLAATAVAVLLTPYGGVATQRYWLPVLSVLPVIMGLWLARLPRPATCLLLAVLGAIHVASHVIFVPHVRPDYRAFGEALSEAGVRHAYADYWTAALLTYYSGGALTVADLHGDWYPLEERPDFSTLPAVILPAADRAYGDTLRLAGIQYTEHRVGRFVVYQPTVLPHDRRRPLARQTWTAAAWPNGADAWKGLDGDPDSRWSSSGPQRTGMWFQVDLGREELVSGVRLEVGRHATDFPRAIGIEISPDGATWRTVAAVQHGLRPGVRVVGNAFRHDPESADHDIRFPPVETRFVRLSIPTLATAAVDTRFDWSIVELDLFTPADVSAGAPGPER